MAVHKPLTGTYDVMSLNVPIKGEVIIVCRIRGALAGQLLKSTAGTGTAIFATNTNFGSAWIIRLSITELLLSCDAVLEMTCTI